MYCKRCDRRFPSSHAIAQHLNDSSQHHRCSVCDFDGPSWDILLEHHRSTKHRAVCQGCDDGDGMIWDPKSKEYLDHLHDDNACLVCEGHFDSLSNLEHHKITHLDRNIECYGCYRTFKSYSYMISHIEKGGCPSDITPQDLNITAAQCYQSHKFIDKDYRTDMLDGEDLEELYTETVFPFQCPGCDSDFSTLSGLLQHALSHTCGQTLQSGAIGKLIKWLDKKHR
ncbi:hypothetical protein SVAN01_01496 [Stagonosporopsis vannaccii]|nr:hypothetical protein SVAN01_01496 [Stagonosporopsis vannaccii]